MRIILRCFRQKHFIVGYITYGTSPVIEPIAKFSPDCIISDLMMATMDGLEFCDEIRHHEKFDKINIVILSARDDEHRKEKALDRGTNGYLTKPINITTSANELAVIIKAP